MSSRNQNVINVAIMDDSEQWAKQFINTIQKVAGQAEVSVSLDKAQMKEDVSAIESDINKLKKDLKAVKTGKIDSKGFDEFKKVITKDVDVLKEKTANLESVVQSLVKTMADSDAGALSKMLQDVQGNMEQLQKTAMNTVDAVSAIRQAGKDFGQDVNLVNPNEATLLERERKTLVQMFQTFKRMDSVLDGHSSVAQLVKGLQEAADEFKFNAKMYSQEGLEQELEAHYQKFVELQKKLSDASENEATAIQKELLTVGSTFSDLYNKAINSKQFNFKKNNVFQDYIDSINEGLDEAYNQAATRYEKIAGKLKTLGVDKPVEDMQGGIEIKTTPDELKQKAADIIKLAQDFLDSRPLYATVDLNTKWGNRKNQKAIKDFQAKIDTLSAGGNIEEVEKLKQLYEDVRQSFNKDIDINIKTHFKESEDKIDSAVSNIQNKLKEKNFDIKTYVTFGPEAETRLQTDLQNLADATTLTLTNVKIGDKAGKKAIDKATLNGALTNLIDNTARISGGTDDVYDNLVKIREVLESLPSVTDNVVNSLHELARLMSTAFHITGGDELNTTFDGLQKRVANIVKSIDGNIKGQIKEDLGQIVKEFNSEYKNLGGEKELFDLSDNEKIRGWFKRNASKFKDEAKEVNSSSTQIGENLTESYAKGIEQATPVVIEAVDKLSETAVDTAKDNLQNWNTVGKQSVGSFANGIEDQIPKVESAVDKMVSAALAALSSGLDHSSGDMGKILSDKMTQTLPQELGESLKASAQTIDFNKANEGINDVNSSLNGLDLILKKIVENVDDVSQLSDALSKLQNYQAKTNSTANITEKSAQIIESTNKETQTYQKQSEVIAQIEAARKRLSQNKIDSINASLDNFKVPGSSKKQIASEARSRLKVQAENLNKLGDNAPWEEQYAASIKFLKLFEAYRDNMAGKTSATLKQYQSMYDALKPRQKTMEADLRQLISGVNLEQPKKQTKYIESNLTEMGNAGKKATETLSQGEEDAYQKAVKLSERLAEIKTQMIALANTEDGSLHSQIGKDVLYYTPNHKGEATEGELQLRSLIKEYNKKILEIRDLGYVDINGELLKKNLQSNDLLDEKLMNQLKSRASKEQSAAKVAKYLNHYKLTSDERFLDDILGTLDSEGISGNLGDKIYKIVEDELNRISTKTSTPSPVPEIAKETTEQLNKVEEKAKETAQQVEKAISTTVESPLSNVDKQIAEIEKKLEAEKKLAQVYANPTNQAEKDLQTDALFNVNRLTEELKKLQAQKESVAKTPTPEIIDTKKTEQEISVVEKNFEKLQAIAKNYGNWNLNKKGAKHDLSTMIDQFIKYKRDGGTKSLSDLTNNEKALEKLQKEYDRQMSAIQQKAKETANVTKQELKTVTEQAKVEKDIAKEEPKTSSPLTDKAQKIVDGMQKASSETKEVVKNIQEIGNATSQASTQVQSLDSKFESIKQATKGFGSFNLSLTADKDGIQSIISNFIDYKKQGGTKELSDLTNNKNALKKLQKEYRNQMGAIKTEVTQTVTAVKEQTNQLAQSTEKAQASIKKPISSSNTQKVTQEIKEQTAEIKEQTVEIEKNKQAKKENISTPAVDTKATEGASSIKEETSAFTQMPESAEKAASAKKEFAEANKAVLESIVNSLRGLDAESRGFGNLYKLINSIGGTKGDEKIDRVVEGLLKLRNTFNMPMETNNTLLTQLNELASAGENLKDLAEVLKATRTQVKNALKQVADNKDSILNDPDSSKLVSMYATEYLEKSGSFKVVDTQVKELEHGLVQVIALTKDANDQFQEFNLKTKDGFNFETVGMDENTARIAKQLKVFRQVQLAFERMNAKAQNTTDTMFVNGNDKASFNIVNQYLDEFGVHLGDIQKIVRSVRKEGEDFLESFHVIGTLGDIDFGRDGILFDNQNIYDADKVVKMYKELTSDAKNYFELKEKIVSDNYSEDDIEHFQRLQNKIHETNDAAKNLIAILGDNPLITEARNKFAVTTSDNYQKSLQQFIKTQTNQFKNKDIVNANQRIDFAPEIQKQVDEAKKALSELQGILNKGLDADKFSDEALKNIHKLVDTVRKASLSVKEASGKEVSQRMVDKLASQVSNTIHENTAMPKGLMSQFKDLEARLKAIGQHTDEAGNHIADINNIKFNQLKDEFHSLDAQLEASGQKGKNFVDRITSAVKNNAVQFLARYASFYDLLRYGQQIYSTINNLDYALVDLKKTTTMSTSELNSFYTASNDIAKQNGVTTKTIIDQAAAWSRLNKIGRLYSNV